MQIEQQVLFGIALRNVYNVTDLLQARVLSIQPAQHRRHCTLNQHLSTPWVSEI